jgi:hypothetical protein
MSWIVKQLKICLVQNISFFPHLYYKIRRSMDSAGNPSYASVENDPF